MPKPAADDEDDFEITVSDEDGLEIEVEDDTPEEAPAPVKAEAAPTPGNGG